jgi:hypothetical protein
VEPSLSPARTARFKALIIQPLGVYTNGIKRFDTLAVAPYDQGQLPDRTPTARPKRGVKFEDFCNEKYLPWHASEYPDSHYRVAQLFRDYLLPFFGNYRSRV